MARLLIRYDRPNEEGPIRSKNEVDFIEVPRPDFTITPETILEYIGTIREIIDTTIVVESDPNQGHKVLDIGTLLAYEDRAEMGEVKRRTLKNPVC